MKPRLVPFTFIPAVDQFLVGVERIRSGENKNLKVALEGTRCIYGVQGWIDKVTSC